MIPEGEQEVRKGGYYHNTYRCDEGERRHGEVRGQKILKSAATLLYTVQESDSSRSSFPSFQVRGVMNVNVSEPLLSISVDRILSGLPRSQNEKRRQT